MARLFISHSSADNAAAIALAAWLAEQGFDDVFLDIDPQSGLVMGERWQEALRNAADRCEAVLFLVSPAWLASRWCLAEFLLAKTLHKRIFNLMIETVPLERLPPEMIEWQICDLRGGEPRREFDVQTPDGPATATLRESGLDLLRRGLLQSGLDGRSFPWPPPDDPERAPYRGLKALEPRDAAIFLGRDTAIVRGMDQIRGLVESGLGAFLVILGASGAGKSSFLRAGLWPRLARDDVTFLPLPVVRPEAAVLTGAHGLAAALAAAFVRLGAPRPRGAIKQALAEDDDALHLLLAGLRDLAGQRLRVGPGAAPDPVIVLAVDQMEELFAPDGTVEAARFLHLVAPLLARGARARVLLVATIRSDRYAELQAAPALEGVRQDLFNLPPMPAIEFRGVIEGPAQRATQAGRLLAVAPPLTARLIEEAQGADALPLLGFTLERLFEEYGESGTLTLAHYEALGGGRGVLEVAVAAALAEPGRAPAIPADPGAQFDLLRAAFIPWLARIDPATRMPRRRVAALAELPDGARPVVARLVAARLLVTDHRDGADVVEVAHESLLRNWPALRAWLDEDAADLVMLEGFEWAASDWARNGRAEAWLDHRGPRLAETTRILARADFGFRLDAVGAAYLAACRAREAAERDARRAAARRLLRRTQLGLAVSLVLLVFAAAGAWFGFSGQNAFHTQYDVAERARLRNLALALKTEANLNVVQAVATSVLPSDVAAATRSPELLDRLMVAANDNLERLVLAHADSVLAARFSPDGGRIVTASADKTARVWDVASGSLLAVLRGHAAVVSDAVFDPEGQRIATASWDRTVRIWDARSGKLLRVLAGHGDNINSLRYSPDGRRLVTASARDKTVRVWDAARGTPILTLGDGAAQPHQAIYSADGRRIVAGYMDGTVRLWDAEHGALVKAVAAHHGEVFGLAFSPDGKRFATASGDRTARIWDAERLTLLTTLTGHGAGVFNLAFSPDGRRVATASIDRTFRLWNATDGALLATTRGSEEDMLNVAFSPDGRSIATSSDDDTARIWRIGDRTTMKILGHDGGVQSAVFTADGRSVLTASTDGTARIWNAATGDLQRSMSDEEPMDAAISPDGTHIVTAGNFGATIWDATRGRPLAALRGHGQIVQTAVFSSDNKQVLTASSDGTARLWDAATGAPTKILVSTKQRLAGAVFSPDGKRIAAALSDGTAQIVDASSGHVLTTLRGHDSIFRNVSFSLDGRRVVTASSDRTARIWNADTGDTLAVLVGHEDGLTHASFSPDGRLVATASRDLTARIWDAATGTELAILVAHTAAVNGVAFSPEGRRIVTASDDKTARIWSLPDYLGPGDLSLIRATASRDIDDNVRTRYALPSPPPATAPPPAQCGDTGEVWPRPAETPATFAAWTAGATAGNGACHQRLAEHFGDGLQPGADLARAFFHHAIAARLLAAQGDEPGAQHERYRREALAWMLPRRQVEALMDAADAWQPGHSFADEAADARIASK